MNIVTPINLASNNYTNNAKDRVSYNQMYKMQDEDQIQLSFKSAKRVSKVVDNKKLLGKLGGLSGIFAVIANLSADRKKIDFSKEFDPTKYKRFRHIPGERKGNYIYQKDANGKVIREFYSSNQKKLRSMTEYDPETKNKTKETAFWLNGKTVWYISEYNPETGKKTKTTYFHKDGKTVWFVEKYDTETGYMTKEKTSFQKDGKTIERIYEYNTETGKITKETHFRKDGKTIDYTTEYAQTGEKTKETRFRKDGTKIFIYEYDPEIRIIEGGK